MLKSWTQLSKIAEARVASVVATEGAGKPPLTRKPPILLSI
jgi:hypothetical protein